MAEETTLVEHSEHRAIVFKFTRKEAAALARYIKDHSGSPEMIIAVDTDACEMIVQAKTAAEEDFMLYSGEEDIMDVDVEDIEENEVVDIEVDE